MLLPWGISCVERPISFRCFAASRLLAATRAGLGCPVVLVTAHRLLARSRSKRLPRIQAPCPTARTAGTRWTSRARRPAARIPGPVRRTGSFAMSTGSPVISGSASTMPVLAPWSARSGRQTIIPFNSPASSCQRGASSRRSVTNPRNRDAPRGAQTTLRGDWVRPALAHRFGRGR